MPRRNSAGKKPFQSTLPVWGATHRVWVWQDTAKCFNPRSPCGERRPAGCAAVCARRCFNPRSPCGERRRSACCRSSGTSFQSTLPVWGATAVQVLSKGSSKCFNPRSPCGERPSLFGNDDSLDLFQSTLPVWGATAMPSSVAPMLTFQSTLPVWGATQLAAQQAAGEAVSIHAPRVGSDVFTPSSESTINCFNPRSPCGERPDQAGEITLTGGFNPRSPCGERQSRRWRVSGHFNVSIHAPRVGSDGFAETPQAETKVSIHAPRVGSDTTTGHTGRCRFCFNPRSPCGERRHQPRTIILLQQFQSTLPVWGATVHHIPARACDLVSIHAPRVGSDAVGHPGRPHENVSIHAPRVGSDSSAIVGLIAYPGFNPRSPCGERLRPERKASP